MFVCRWPEKKKPGFPKLWDISLSTMTHRAHACANIFLEHIADWQTSSWCRGERNDRQVPLEKMTSKCTVMEGSETLGIVVNQEWWWWSLSVGKVLIIYLRKLVFIVFLVYFVPLFIQEESTLLSRPLFVTTAPWLTLYLSYLISVLLKMLYASCHGIGCYQLSL